MKQFFKNIGVGLLALVAALLPIYIIVRVGVWLFNNAAPEVLQASSVILLVLLLAYGIGQEINNISNEMKEYEKHLEAAFRYKPEEEE